MRRLADRALERETALVDSAVEMVAGGHAARMQLGGLAFGDALLDHARRIGAGRGVRVTPHWGVGEEGLAMVFEPAGGAEDSGPAKRPRMPTRTSPRSLAANQAKFRAHLARTTGRLPVAEGRILLVEDDESLRSVVARHLRARGWDVTEATSAEEAARAVATGPRPSLVLLDINLPGETGWDLLRGGAVGTPRRTTGRHRLGNHHRAEPAARVRRRRIPAQAIRARDAARGVRAIRRPSRPAAGGPGRGHRTRGEHVTDIVILVIGAGCAAFFAGLLVLCDRVGR